MLAADLVGVWSATQTPPALAARWAGGIVERPMDDTMHYFLVVTQGADGSLHAFIRNPEANAGASFGNRILVLRGASLSFAADGKPDVTGSAVNGALTISELPSGAKDLEFHHPSAQELRWYYPRPTTMWTYRAPVETGDGWPIGDLQAAGLREAPLAELIDGITSLRTPQLRSPYIQSVAIARHGRLVFDEYFYGFTAATPHDVRSAGKSVTSLLVGRAMEQTRRFTLDTPVVSFLPQYAPVAHDDGRKARITVGNLLTMTSGLACDDYDDNSPGNEDTMQSQTAQPDWYKYTLDLPMQYDPGSHAAYCSAGINLLGAVISRATGVPLQRYFYGNFARPMEFEQYGMWLMPPPANAAYMAGGDYFRPRDFLKFGQLFLDRGAWNGTQIIGADWLAASVELHSTMSGNDRYGLGWHLSSLSVDGRTYSIIDAGGNGGQIMAIVPRLDMAVMITAGNYGQYPVWKNFLAQIVGAAIRSAS